MGRLSFALTAVLAIMICTGISSAFTLDVSTQESSVDVEQVSTFEFAINSEISDRFSVHTKGMKPWMTIEEIGTVEAGVPKTFRLYASPSYTVASGTYGVKILARSEVTNETEEKTVFITVLKSVFASIDKVYISGSLQPAGYADIKVNIKNLDVVTMNGIDIIATLRSPSGVIGSFNQTIEQLNPMESRTIQRIISLPPGAEAGKYSLGVSAFYNKKIFNQKTQEFDVISIPVISKDYSEGVVFIGREKSIEVTNYGNAVSNEIEVEESIGGLEEYFFFQVRGPQSDVSKGTATWSIDSLAPGKTVKITYQINYLPLLIIIAISLLSLWFVLFNVRVIEVRKSVLKKSDDDISVSIEIKNMTGKELDSVILKDTIPLIFRVKSFVGLPPVRKRDEQGFALIWRIKKLKPAEERVFSYKIVPVIKVAGSMKLPAAKIMYKNMRTVFVKKSGNPSVGWQH